MMPESEYNELIGEVVSKDHLRLVKAQALASLLDSDHPYPFASLVEYRQITDAPYREIVIFDTEVEVSQHPVHDIRRTERVAAVFHDGDLRMPEVMALRKDFPDVPHLNVTPYPHPKSLCLTDQPYAEVKLHWTAVSLVESVRTWLKLTAEGRLHQDDQPLEPLLGGAEMKLILPADLISAGDGPEALFCRAIAAEEGETQNLVVIASRSKPASDGNDAREFRAIPVQVPVVLTHGLIRWQPATLKQLADFLSLAGYDLLHELRERLRRWVGDSELLGKEPIFVMALQKRRTETGPVEATETWAFASPRSIGDVGEAIGIFGKVDGRWGINLSPDLTCKGETVPLELMLPYFTLSRETAANYNGQVDRYGGRLVAIGLGALGSQVFDNLMRSGFGEWTLVDSDHLLPHNLARHALHGAALGYPKVFPLAIEANQTIDGEQIATFLVTDVLSPGSKVEELEQCYRAADLILDMSASVAVSRHLARHHDDIPARRISLFVNPAGTDLVMLAEDASRQYRLDALEMQYYRAVASDPALHRHLRLLDGRFRYGRSCRDTTMLLPQEQVGLHAAIGSRAVRQAQENPQEALIRIWRADDPDLQVRLVNVKPVPVIEEHAEGWTICTDERLLYNVRCQRRARLPNETGGILIGSFDMERQIVYIVDLVPSPPDSIEQPTLYIRGYAGLRQEVTRIMEATTGRLGYAGEWHSHPPGCSASLSGDDRTLFDWLKEEMVVAGHPPVMLVIGETEYRWYVKTLPITIND